jgi:hypothetical protein
MLLHYVAHHDPDAFSEPADLTIVPVVFSIFLT